MTTYRITRELLEEGAIANLEGLASARQEAIEHYILNLFVKLNSFEEPDLEIQVDEMLQASGAEQTALKQTLIANLQRKHLVDPNLEWVDILDMTGTIIVSTFTKREGISYADEQFFLEGEVRPYITPPFIEEGRIYIKLSLPLHDKNNRTIAVLVMRYNAKELLAITGDYTGLGNTGETYLGIHLGDEIHFLTPLRFDPNLSEIQPAPADGERALPMIHATSGQSGVTTAPDYRGVQVLSAYRPIPIVNWGMVVEQDVSEAYAGVTEIQNSLGLSVGMLLLVGIVVLLPLVRTALQPLHQLESATRQLAEGDLNTKVPISSEDEVGQLGKSFNLMVDSLRDTQNELNRSNQELASFAYAVSHDLRAPLRSIASLTEWLGEDLGDDLKDEQREQMNLIRNRVRTMDELIKGLLEYSRVGRVKNPEIDVDVDILLSNVIEILMPPENIKVVVNQSMPTLHTDEIRLSQVFQNLIDNAVKFHPGPQGQIEITYSDSDPLWKFSIQDDGFGIEPKYHKRIFQIFQSLHPRGDADSTGIGLALVKRIVEEHGGEVWVESEGIPGQGSTFWFTWPKKE